MNNNFENIKGTYDYLPKEQIVRQNIKRTLENTFEHYGFSPIETPIICKYDLLASKYSEGADILNEMYKLSDQGKRELGLRYDLTITFSKLISLNKDLSMPFKRYEIGKVFRDGPVKLGRNREFTQCDVDVVGVKSMLQEAEFMTMCEEVFKKLGIDIEIEYNNRKLLTGLIELIFGELSIDKIRYSIMLIDKITKLTDKEFEEEFNKIGIDSEKLFKLKAIISISDFEEMKSKIEQVGSNKNIEEGLNEIEKLNKYLKDTQALNVMKFSPNLARGFDTYTGTVWEVFLKNRKINNLDFNVSIGGGGRYDKIIESFIENGNEYPAIGMSFGLDGIYDILIAKDVVRPETVTRLLAIPMGTEIESFKLITKIREKGINADIDKTGKNIKKCMNYANKMGISYVTIIGDNEINKNKINIKNMESGENYEVSLDNINEIVNIIK